TGLEPATPGVTGRYSNQLNYRSLKPLAPANLPGTETLLVYRILESFARFKSRNLGSLNFDGFTSLWITSGTRSALFNSKSTETDQRDLDRKSTRLNSSHVKISYAVFCLKKK